MAAANNGDSRRGRSIVVTFAIVVAALVLGILIGLNLTTIRQAMGAVVAASTQAPSEAPPVNPKVTPSAAPVTGILPLSVSYAQVNEDNGSIDASGFVAGVIETDATCTLTATHGASVVTATNPGMPDAQVTQCGLLTIDAGLLVPGDWVVQLSYESASSRAISPSITLTVP